ncbi:MAG: tetratricopeptide repeat protein [Candidatus Zixiibacteriota bacterium]|nr:MAG: tetratricopeptide repeat protein [candidate division Zixibacteria bacterium]
MCYIYAKSGDTLRADSLLLVISQRVEHPQLSTDYLIPRAAIEFVRGNFDTAALYFKRADSLDAEFATKIFLARSHLGAGRLDDAVTSFERALKWYGESHAFVPGLSVLAHYWLGQAYEESGWTKKAVEQYETFLDIWKDADPGIEEIEDAKLRLARLKNTP